MNQEEFDNHLSIPGEKEYSDGDMKKHQHSDIKDYPPVDNDTTDEDYAQQRMTEFLRKYEKLGLKGYYR